MDFTEEKTPSGITLNIMLKSWNFVAFQKSGESVYADKEGRSVLHKVPTLIFLGKTMSLQKRYTRDYELYKVRDNEIIIPYYTEEEKKFLFIPYLTDIDLLPVLVFEYQSYSEILKEHPSGEEIDHLIIDNTISEVEQSVLLSRYKPKNIINIQKVKNNKKKSKDVPTSYSNVNILSENPVFLAQIHLRKMALANLKQILLDFEISSFDAQIIINLINSSLKKINSEAEEQKKPPSGKKTNTQLLQGLKKSFEFYLALAQKDAEKISQMVQEQTDYRQLAPFRTLVLKVKSETEDESDLEKYSEFEKIVAEKAKKLMS